MDRKLHVDTLILIPMKKFYVFSHSGQMDEHLYLIPTWFALALSTGIVSSGVCRTN